MISSFINAIENCLNDQAIGNVEEISFGVALDYCISEKELEKILENQLVNKIYLFADSYFDAVCHNFPEVYEGMDIDLAHGLLLKCVKHLKGAGVTLTEEELRQLEVK
ncbi:MAG: hypothetical protein COC04_01330 [Gammaproteobacteria bacterium]|nr:MAG: hypothetical protein COC04_01330 [Gammaproteobacteria bacterium]